jgi:hypothetical protein
MRLRTGNTAISYPLETVSMEKVSPFPLLPPHRCCFPASSSSSSSASVSLTLVTAGRAHGGLNALLLDHITGTTASHVGGGFAPATATMTVDYKAPIDTPCVVLVRGWAVERSGRKTWVQARIEGWVMGKDGRKGWGEMVRGKALFVDPKPGAPGSMKL